MDFGPTLGGFVEFVTWVMMPPAPFDPATSIYMPGAFDFAQQLVNQNLQLVPQRLNTTTSLYSLAVYNLAADTLINFAQDQPSDPVYKDKMPYWAWLRHQYGVNSFVPGVVQSTGDNGTSASYLLPAQMQNYTIANIQNTKTPYGRQYLAIAGSWGSLWGLD